MKKVVLILVVSLFIMTTANAQGAKTGQLKKMTLLQVCRYIGIPADYNARYKEVILPLCHQGVVIFNGKLRKNYLQEVSYMKPNEVCYWYSGQAKQNAKLKRNLIKNRYLFKNGRLIKGAAKKWIVVN